MFDSIINFVESLFNIIISIVDFIISAVNGFATFIATLPEAIDTIIQSTGGVLTMTFALFNNLPSNLWLGVMVVLAGNVIAFFMWKNNN